MNRTLAVVSALGVGLSTAVFTGSAMAQAAAPAAPAAAAAPVTPEAIPAKIAVIDFRGAVMSTNEGQKAGQALQEKFAPQQQKIQAEGADVDNLRKQLEALPPTTPDAEKQARAATIDSKEKQLNLDLETAQNQYQADMQDTMSKVAAKFSPVLNQYLKAKGFTLLLSVGEQSDIMWADDRTNITQAVIDEYNKTSGVAAPLPAAPAAGATARPRTAPATTPRPPARTAPAAK